MYWFIFPAIIGIISFIQFLIDIAVDKYKELCEEFQCMGLSKWVKYIPVYCIYALAKKGNPWIFYFWLFLNILASVGLCAVLYIDHNSVTLSAVSIGILAFVILASVVGGAWIVHSNLMCFISFMDTYNFQRQSSLVVIGIILAVYAEITMPGSVKNFFMSILPIGS